MSRTHHRGYARGLAGSNPEVDTITCGHHGGVVFLKPGNGTSTPCDMCHACMKFICPACAAAISAGAKCRTFEARLDAVESRQRFLSSI